MARKYKRLSDQELVSILVEGTKEAEAAFTELYNRYSSMVHAYCYRVLGDPYTAEDVFQDVFIKFYQNIKVSGNATNIPGFLITISRNMCLNLKRDVRVMVPIEDLEILDEDSDNYETAELLNLITVSIDLLDFDFKEAFVMREYDGLSYNEIARITGTSVSNAKSRVFRAKQKLKEILMPYLKEMI